MRYDRKAILAAVWDSHSYLSPTLAAASIKPFVCETEVHFAS
jgi:hypothetical protein